MAGDEAKVSGNGLEAVAGLGEGHALALGFPAPQWRVPLGTTFWATLSRRASPDCSVVTEVIDNIPLTVSFQSQQNFAKHLLDTSRTLIPFFLLNLFFISLYEIKIKALPLPRRNGEHRLCVCRSSPTSSHGSLCPHRNTVSLCIDSFPLQMIHLSPSCSFHCW